MRTNGPAHTLLAALLVFNAAQGGAQYMKGIDRDELEFNIISDVKVRSAGDQENVPATGSGQLGASFRKDYFYGAVLFNVVNRNAELSTGDSTEVATFANNLLIPDNSGQGVSNFRSELGVKSLAPPDDDDWTGINLLSCRRFGINGFWQVNNTQWTKDTVTTPLFISSFGVNATYALLSAEIQNQNKDKVNISFSMGWEARRIGGDYALAKNEAMRYHFLGTPNTAFNSVVLGVTLELGDFYGRIQHYNFGEKEQIDGFSGYQTLITLGLNVEFNVAAKETAPRAAFKKKKDGGEDTTPAPAPSEGQ